MNLLDETKSAISRSKHSTDDVRFVGSRDEKLGIPWSQAEKVLDIDYDDGYGSQEIAADLVVAFTDGGFLRREEYDGSEWWEYEPPFRGPETQKPFGRVKRTYPAYSLEDINYPMEADDEGDGRGDHGAREGNRRRTMSDCYLCRKPLHGDSSSVDIKRWDPRRNVFFDETRRACAECVRRRNGYQSRRAKARRVAARVLLNKWLDKQMEVDDELA